MCCDMIKVFGRHGLLPQIENNPDGAQGVLGNAAKYGYLSIVEYLLEQDTALVHYPGKSSLLASAYFLRSTAYNC